MKFKKNKPLSKFGKRPYNPKKRPEPVQNEEPGDDGIDAEILDMVDPEDLEFLKTAVTNRTYSILNKVRYTEPSGRGKKRKIEGAEDDSLETTYEKKTKPTEKVRNLLPIKSQTGIIERSILEEETDELFEENSILQETSDDKDYFLEQDNIDTTKPIHSTELMVLREKTLQEKKLHIGTLSSGLLENPEEKLSNFRTLLKILDEEAPDIYFSIRKLSMVSLLEVFKDVLPGYQIKLRDLSVKVKKDTLKQHKFEEGLLQYYKNYLQSLEGFAKPLYKSSGKKLNEADLSLAELAAHCMCDLLIAHPYFNYAPNLAQAIIPLLNCRNKNVRTTVSAACKTIFKEDKKEEISLKMIRCINQYLKNHLYKINADFLEVLLHLRIKEVNLDGEKEQDLKQKKLEAKKQNLLKLSKRERKRQKQLKVVEKELLETKAEENQKTKHANLTEITKLLFAIYFRILKSVTNTRILSVTLEGLAKFAHCINLEYYVDIVNVLDKLLREDWLGYREKLNCIQTVFQILGGQGEVIDLDPSRFYKSLYKDLLTTNASNSHINFMLMLSVVTNALIRRRKRITNKRLISFIKRLSTLSLQLLHNGTLGCLGVIKTMLQLNSSVDILLDMDNSVGEGSYDAEVDDPEYTGASSTSLCELALLSKHYHPIVSKLAKHIANGVPASGEGSLPADLNKLSPEALCVNYDMSEMVFNPAIPIPQTKNPKIKYRPHEFWDESFKEYCLNKSRLNMNKNVTFYLK